MAEVTHPPLDGKSGEPVFLALVPRDPLLLGPTGVAAAQPGEAGVKHPAISQCTLLSLSSTVPHIRTPLGRPKQQLTAVRLGGGHPGGASPHPLCLYLRTALSAARCGSLLLSLPQRRGHTVGSGSGQPAFETHVYHSPLPDFGCDTQTLRSDRLVSHLRSGVSDAGSPEGQEGSQ